MVTVADPEVGSVPAWKTLRYWLAGRPRFDVRYCVEGVVSTGAPNVTYPQGRLTLTNKLMSPLNEVTLALLVGKNEKTWFAPLLPSYKFLHERKRCQHTPETDTIETTTYHARPAMFRLLTMGLAVPSAFQLYEMGPAL